MTTSDLLLLLFAQHPLSIPAFQPNLAVLEARIVAAGDGLLGCDLYPFQRGVFSAQAEIGVSQLLRDGLVESVKGGRIRLGLTTLGRARVAMLTKGEEGRAVARLVRLGKREGAEVLREQWGRLDKVNLEARGKQRETPPPGETGWGVLQGSLDLVPARMEPDDDVNRCF